MKLWSSISLAAVVVALLAPNASADTPRLCGSSGCVAVSASAAELDALLTGSSVETAPPHLSSYFKLVRGGGRPPVFVVPSGDTFYVQAPTFSGWRAISRANAAAFARALDKVLAYGAPSFSQVKIGKFTKADTQTYASLFGKLKPGGKASGKPVLVQLVSTQPNPWSKTPIVVYPGKNTVKVGGVTYAVPKEFAALFKRDAAPKKASPSEPDWPLLLLGLWMIAAFVVSVMQVRWQRHEQRLPGEPLRRVPPMMKLGGGGASLYVGLAVYSGTTELVLVLVGLVVLTAAAADLFGRERVGYWLTAAPAIAAVALYLTKK